MTQKEYIALVDRCKQLSYEYYVLAQPTVSDAQFDALVAEIEQAEVEHPEWTLADSPTQQVGSDLQDNGRRWIRHRTRMLSCQKAQTQEAVTKWITSTEKKLKKQEGLHYILEWKLDGISCSLVYQDGVLISAATRGDKDKGQDLLAHVKLMPSVPKQITLKGRVEVRGEIVCPKAELAALGYKDCRTAAAALTNQVVPTDDMKQLEFVVWQLDTTEELGTETAGMCIAVEQGFKTSDYKGCWSEDVLKRLDEFETKREAYEYPTDGVVIKIDTRLLAQSLGYTEHHPKGNIAYKFSAQKAITKVIRIEISVGATGKRTPVAYLEPVMIMGREVSAASLYSEAKMTELGVTAGCTVEVGLSNDVTPKIYRVIMEDDNNQCEDVEEATINQCDVVETPTEVPTNEQPVINNDSELERLQQENEALQARIAEMEQQAQQRRDHECAERLCREDIQQPAPTPRPKRQRKPRKPVVEHQPSAFSHQPSKSNGHPWLTTAGYLAAASVALLVIWQTGLIIPLGLIGLATSGLIK